MPVLPLRTRPLATSLVGGGGAEGDPELLESLLLACPAATRCGGVQPEVESAGFVAGDVRWKRCAVPRAEDTASQSPEEEKATPWMIAGVTPRESLRFKQA